ncbi:Uncharacterised protein [Mycobacteroides abscessus subsp. abscessus]|nr:Uncharacterised protein [Mycobacteroides abscessus subsp. abscessus]
MRRLVNSSTESSLSPSSGLSSVYWKTSPKPVETGPSTGVTPVGMVEATSIRRSITS